MDLRDFSLLLDVAHASYCVLCSAFASSPFLHLPPFLIPPYPHAVAMDRLAHVEAQLVMQFCEPRSTLALARCSHALLAAASAAFAWPSSRADAADLSNIVPLEVPFGVLDLAGKLGASRVLRFAPVFVRWEPSVNGRRFNPAMVPMADEIRSIIQIGNLVGLDAVPRQAPVASLVRILSASEMAGLAELRVSEVQIGDRAGKQLTKCASGLPHLCRLSIECDRFSGYHGVDAFDLSTLPQVTELRLQHCLRGHVATAIGLPNLCSLALVQPNLQANHRSIEDTFSDLLTILSSANCEPLRARLVELDLDFRFHRLSVRSDDGPAWSTPKMPLLSKLTLRRCFSSAYILRAFAAEAYTPALRHLVLQPACLIDKVEPEAASVESYLAARRSLVSLQLTPPVLIFEGEYNPKTIAPHPLEGKALEQWTPLVQRDRRLFLHAME